MLESASKLVFMFVAIASFVLVILGKLEGKDFYTLTAMAFTFYFSNKGNQKNDYLGK